MKSYAIKLKSAGIILFWLLLWQGVSSLLQNSIILVGPFEVIQSLFSQVHTMDFWRTIAFSFEKISLGFLLAFLSGIIAGGAAYRFPLLEDFFKPPITFLKSVPVASFIILALIWIGSENLSLFIAFLVVFPMVYLHTIAGFRSADEKILEMAGVFKIPPLKKLWFIYRPALLPHLISSCQIALGMSFKSGIAAEVIGVPDYSIGERLYMAKIYLSTADLFAWTLVILIISAVFEALFLRILSLAAPAVNKQKED